MFEQVVIDRFLAKINKTPGCWTYNGAHCRDGYGLYSIKHIGQFKAHRFMIMISGITIPKGYVVMHLCDNPGCVNPAHLQVNTIQANNLDKLAKNRQRGAVGTINGRARLTEQLVKQIRQDPRHYTQIAGELGVHPETVRMAKTGVTWRHV